MSSSQSKMSALTGGGGPGGPGGLGGGPGGPGGAPGGKAVNSFKKAVTIKVSKLHSFFDGTIDLPNAEYFSRPALATTAVPRTQSRSSTAGKNQFKGDSPTSHFESCHLKKLFPSLLHQEPGRRRRRGPPGQRRRRQRGRRLLRRIPPLVRGQEANVRHTMNFFKKKN